MRHSRNLLFTTAIALATGFFGSQAKAAFIVNLVEDGSGNVVATGSGTIDTTDLTYVFNFSRRGQIYPSNGQINLGPASNTPSSLYDGVTTGPTSFGSGSITNPSSGSGDFVEIVGANNQLYVPSGYVSGTALSDTDTWSSASFSSLGATPGTYVWTWGTGADADSYTLNVGSSVPEPASLSLLGIGAAALLGRRRRVV